ncbi:MAG: hypothetical protein D6816_18205 [Bacteroidetes bacterium]|nr:MAG: hypothetical protein D6816_18205 [Bacteroidota bacterium]
MKYIKLILFTALAMLAVSSEADALPDCSPISANGTPVESPFYFPGGSASQQAYPLHRSNSDRVTRSQADTYHTIIDHTQADHAKVMVSNTQTKTSKGYPLMAARPNPVAAINHDTLPWSSPPSPSGQVDYVQVQVDDTDLTTQDLSPTNGPTPPFHDTETNATKGVVSTSPGTVSSPGTNTYLNRLGTWYDPYTTGTTKLVPLEDSSGQSLQILNLFDPNNGFGGQAFDLDRIRYAANKLWKKWKSDAGSGGTNNAATDWHTKFGYQPTGTMSFEQYIDNIENERPMFGIVRVVIPVSGGKAWYSPSYKTNCVNGNEFSTASCTSTAYSSRSDVTAVGPLSSAYVTATSCKQEPEQKAKKVIVYGMLMYDYVTKTSYKPWEFADANQDYQDNQTTGTTNTQAPGIYLKVYESLLINPTNDHFMLDNSYSYVAGEDYRMDSLENARYHMINGSIPDVSEISDAAAFEYLMRKAVKDGVSAPSAVYTNYNFRTETLASAPRTTFTSAYSALSQKDKFHLLFPSGYERGWMIAMDALDMTLDDWSQLPTKAATTVGSANGSTSPTTYQVAWVTKKPSLNKTDYKPFKVPSETLDIDTYNGTAQYQGSPAVTDTDPSDNAVPNVFTKGWEDFPGLSFAGGVLDMHAHANISGMLYTPDSGEIEAKKEKYAAFQYVNGAILIRHGVWLEDGCKSGDGCYYSMIAVSFNPYAFDQLRTSPKAFVGRANDLRELVGD